MTQARKSKSQLLFIKELVWGELPSISAGATLKVPFEGGETLDSTAPRVPNPHVTGNRNYSKGVPDRVDSGGDIPFKMNGLPHGLFLRAMVGSDTITGSDPYTHTFQTGEMASYAIEKGFTDINEYFIFLGMRCASWELTVNVAGYLDVSTSWMGKGQDDDSPTDTSKDASPSTYEDRPFGMAKANTVLTEGGVAISTVTALTMRGDNELDGDSYVIANKGRRGCLEYDRQRITGTMTAFFKDETLYNKAKNDTKSSIEVSIQHGTGDGSAGNEKLVLTLAEIYFFKSTPKIGTSGAVNVELEFESVEVTGTESFKAVLLNAVPLAY